MKKVLLAIASMLLLTTGMAAAEETTLQIDGDYRFKADMLKGDVHEYMRYNPSLMTGGFYQPGGAGTPAFLVSPNSASTVKNDAFMTNRFGVNLKATPLEDLSVKARFLMYKVWGHQTSTPGDGAYFADRAMGPNDGTTSHVPQDSTMRADYAYTTLSNIGNMPLWFSVGRRPSAGGVPTNLKDNREKVGTGGIPAIMVDYAFDGLTIGFAPDIEVMPGMYAKLCYGKGFDSGFQSTTGATLKDTDFLGLNAALYDTDNLHVEIQYQQGWNIFNAPSDGSNLSGPVTANLGDINWIGGVVMGKVSNLNLFFTAAQSKTTPNDGTLSMPFMSTDDGATWTNAGYGLLYDQGMTAKESHTGTAVYLGGRYDIASTGTKIGAEYNQGSQYWIGMVPAGDDVWTSKLGTRGSVYEVYIIQELRNKAIAKKGQAFFKLGYQAYKFEYTGSNSWIGAPKKISELNNADPTKAQMLAPISKATDLYLTMEVRF